MKNKNAKKKKMEKNEENCKKRKKHEEKMAEIAFRIVDEKIN